MVVVLARMNSMKPRLMRRSVSFSSVASASIVLPSSSTRPAARRMRSQIDSALSAPSSPYVRTRSGGGGEDGHDAVDGVLLLAPFAAVGAVHTGQESWQALAAATWRTTRSCWIEADVHELFTKLFMFTGS